MFAIRKNFLYKNITEPGPRQAGAPLAAARCARLDNYEHAGVSEDQSESSVTQALPGPTQARASQPSKSPSYDGRGCRSRVGPGSRTVQRSSLAEPRCIGAVAVAAGRVGSAEGR